MVKESKVIAVIAKAHHPRLPEVLEGVAAWARQWKIQLLLDRETAGRFRGRLPSMSQASLAKRADLLLVLGGDGTLLSAARAINERQIPILGVNMGSMGFLTEFTLDELLPALEAIRAGEYEVEDRIMLTVELIRRRRVVSRYTALNDCVINNGALARMTDLDITVDDQHVTNFKADGLIVATPTGSTAYSLSAGGPIVQPSLGAIILTPICPHILTNRPLVLRDNVTLRVDLRNGSDVMLTVDGQVGAPMAPGDSILLRKSPFVTRLVQPLNKNHFQVLRAKLKWGER
jgi:NAD+ kinase